MLIVWDYFGVIAQDAFWYTADRLAAGKGMGSDMQQAQKDADLGRISWDEYTSRVASDIGVPLDEVRKRYEHHEIKESNILAIHHLSEHTHVLLSNASAGYLLPIMQRLGLDRLFAQIFVSSDIGVAKPDPRAFEQVLAAMSTPAESAIMIDDSSRNIDAARKLGMKGIVFGSSTDILDEIHAIAQ